jgi:hypothetical protein
VTINDTNVGGNLICADNDPPPTGAGNAVDGNREGRCAGL